MSSVSQAGLDFEKRVGLRKPYGLQSPERRFRAMAGGRSPSTTPSRPHRTQCLCRSVDGPARVGAAERLYVYIRGVNKIPSRSSVDFVQPAQDLASRGRRAVLQADLHESPIPGCRHRPAQAREDQIQQRFARDHRESLTRHPDADPHRGLAKIGADDRHTHHSSRVEKRPTGMRGGAGKRTPRSPTRGRGDPRPTVKRRNACGDTVRCSHAESALKLPQATPTPPATRPAPARRSGSSPARRPRHPP